MPSKTRAISKKERRKLVDSLSRRERLIYSQLLTFQSYQDIAELVGCHVGTVKYHATAVYKKLGITDAKSKVKSPRLELMNLCCKIPQVYEGSEPYPKGYLF